MTASRSARRLAARPRRGSRRAASTGWSTTRPALEAIAVGHRPRKLHRACAWASRPRGRWRSRSSSRSRASRRSTRSPPAPRARSRWSTRAGARSSRSSTASRAASRPQSSAGGPARRRRRASLPGRRSRRAGAEVPPDDDERAPPARPLPCALARDFGAAGRGRADLPPRARRRQGDRQRSIELRRLKLRDLGAIERDRAPLVPDALVALDVRGRADEAVVDLPRRPRHRHGRGRLSAT